MPAFVRRQFVGSAVSTTTTSPLSPSDLSVTISSNTGWPTGPEPFYVAISPGTSNEEKCLATISGLTLSLTRGQDDTSAQTHSLGSTIYPVFTATDADEANEVAAKLTTKGDLLVTSGSALNRLPVGTNNHVLTADSAVTNGVKWAAVDTDQTASTLASSPVNDYVLTADSGATRGIKWAAIPPSVDVLQIQIFS